DVGGAVDLRALGQRDWIGEVVPELPEPFIGRNFQKRVGYAVEKSYAVFEILSAHVHVRMQADQPHILRNVESGVYAIVGIAGRNLEGAVDSRESQHAFFRRFLGKDEPHSCLVRRSYSVRSVVNLEDDIGAGLDQLRLSGRKDFGGLARSISDQEITGQGAR